MKWHVILAHELHIAHVIRAHVGAPPAHPCGIGQPLGIGPLGGGRDVFDGGIEPDVEHLAIHPRPRFVAHHHRHTPVQIAGDATVLQTVAVVQPFPGNRGGQDRPVMLGVDPRRQFVTQ